MTDNTARRSFTRFIPPALLISLGILTMQLDVNLSIASAHEVTVLGFALFAIGAFSFVIIINHARNPLIKDNEIIPIAEILVVYGGVMTFIAHQEWLMLPTLTLAVCIILGIGTIAAVTADSMMLSRNQMMPN